MNQMVDFLNQQLSNWQILYVKLHHFHWNVTGKDFFVLHEKFEALYDETSGFIDDIAERVLALDGIPLSKMADYLEKGTILEVEGALSSEEMVRQTVADFSQLVLQTKKGIDLASEKNDVATEDLLTGIVVSLEKHIWLLESFLK